MSTFYDRYQIRRAALGSVLCVGIDPDPEKIPPGFGTGTQGILDFIENVAEGTAELACAYKPNLAFFEALHDGEQALIETLKILRRVAPDALIIGDAKRGDISNTAAAYARALFDRLGFDAITVTPYMGRDSIEPYLGAEYEDRAVIVVCLTSNPGAQDYQFVGEPPVYARVAADVAALNQKHGNLWLVAGATRDPGLLTNLRAVAPGVPLLVPGVGAQGGDVATVMQATGTDVLINVGRSIMYAGTESTRTRSAAQEQAAELVAQMAPFL